MIWLERFAAFMLIVLFSPVWITVTIASLVLQGRPVFFLQNRVGKDGELFKIIKYRSMRIDNAGSKVTADGDPRITPLGRFLRRTKLDELPQLVNILKGEMAFVGPRPEVPDYVEHYTEDQKKVLDRLPGVTDCASLAFRNEEELMALAPDPGAFYIEEVIPAKIRINLKHRKSLLNDLGVVLQTVMVIAKIKEAPYKAEFAKLEEKARMQSPNNNG